MAGSSSARKIRDRPSLPQRSRPFGARKAMPTIECCRVVSRSASVRFSSSSSALRRLMSEKKVSVAGASS